MLMLIFGDIILSCLQVILPLGYTCKQSDSISHQTANLWLVIFSGYFGLHLSDCTIEVNANLCPNVNFSLSERAANQSSDDTNRSWMHMNAPEINES